MDGPHWSQQEHSEWEIELHGNTHIIIATKLQGHTHLVVESKVGATQYC